MFVLVLAVPALIVVLTGYVATEWVYGLLGTRAARAPEAAGWTTGLLLLAVVGRLLVGWWRRRGGEDGHRAPHQK